MREDSGEKQVRAIPMDDKRFRSDRERDPIAELARLIAQGDTQEESAPSDNRLRQETVSVYYEETPELPPALQLAVYLNEDEPASERDDHCSDDQACDVDDDLSAAEQEYQDSEVPHYPVEEEHQDSEGLARAPARPDLGHGHNRSCPCRLGLRSRLPKHVRRLGFRDASAKHQSH